MKQLRPDQLQRPSVSEFRQSDKMPVCVVLDNVRSGLNVGAIFRTCDVFAVDEIFLCGITARPPHAEIMKTALGATESVSWHYEAQTLQVLENLQQKGYHLLPVEQTDHSLFLDETDLTIHFPVALIFGNEMRGVDPAVLAQCSHSIEIPQQGTKHSINVATTAGIVLWECFRQYRLLR